MPRKPNRNTERLPPGITLTFLPHEFRFLKLNKPGPSGDLGGLAKRENRLIELTNPSSLTCYLDPTEMEQTMRYCRKYGSGGPNGRIKAACIPAFRRQGIELVPGWAAKDIYQIGIQP